MNLAHLLDIANRSGGTLYLMAALLLVALTVVFDRIAYFAKMQKGGDALITLLRTQPSLRTPAVGAALSTYESLPHARLIQASMVEPDDSTRESYAGHLEEIIMQELPLLDRSLWMLDTVITLAPLLGLFGTIVGMFSAFSVLADVQNSSGQVTGGIAEALLATASGLLVAMIGLVFFNGLNTRMRLIIHQMEILKVMLLNRRFGRAASRSTIQTVSAAT